MKQLNIIAALAAALVLAAGCAQKNAEEDGVKIGIVKIQSHPALDAIEQGIQDELADAGIEAKYDVQDAGGNADTAAQIAVTFREEHVDVAVGIATTAAVSLATVIKDTPVVFGTVTDPVGAGLVTTQAHGEGNVTGTSDAIPTAQHIALFKETAGIRTLGCIYASNEENSLSSLNLVKEACEAEGITLVTQAITNSSEVQQAAEAIAARVDGIYLPTDNTVFSALPDLVQVFGEAKKPIFSADVTGAEAGGCLIASGFNYYKAGRSTGEIIVSILNGTPPAEIPVRSIADAGDVDLLLDLDAARNCGITLSADLLSRATMILENGTLTKK